MALATCSEAEMTERVGVKWISPSHTQSRPSVSARCAVSKRSRKADIWSAPWRISSTKSPTCTAPTIPPPRASLHARQLQLLGAMAGHEAGGRDLLPRRRLGPADVD